ncbi:MAG TPA: hypothetical protein VF062_00785 [Candidatus Limnocylindrales bacterium]
MSTTLTAAAHHALVAAQMRMDPVSGNPTKPPGTAPERLNTLWGYGLWLFAAAAALAMLGALAVAMFNHQAGRPNDGFGKVFVILGACVGAGLIGGTVGAVTGT